MDWAAAMRNLQLNLLSYSTATREGLQLGADCESQKHRTGDLAGTTRLFFRNVTYSAYESSALLT
jgi:hypothetical protein